jgi:hypothetical protein
LIGGRKHSVELFLALTLLLEEVIAGVSLHDYLSGACPSDALFGTGMGFELWHREKGKGRMAPEEAILEGF